MNFDELRRLFPITQRAVYLNHAAVSPPPLPTIQAVESQLRDVSENGSLNYRSWLRVREETREQLAAMVNARPEQIAFVRNTSDALSSVANGMSWRDGENIVTYRREFPSNIYPWLRISQTREVELRFCEDRDGRFDTDELCKLIDGRTRVVAISHVQYASGFRADLERIGREARKHGALLVADVVQSLGVVPLNVEAELVDVAAAAAHKWLLTPEGIGILYLSDRAREQVEPTLVGWTSVPKPEDYNNFEQRWNKGTLAWESGTYATALMYGLRTSLKILSDVGVEKIARHLEMLGDYLCERLEHSKYEVVSSRVSDEKSQIMSIRSREGLSPMVLFQGLKSQNIITAPRGNSLRIAPHLYNTIDEIDQLVHRLP
jgi:cysteine desulfurase / selenocysteine lyase